MYHLSCVKSHNFMILFVLPFKEN